MHKPVEKGKLENRELHFDCPAGFASPCTALTGPAIEATYAAMLANPMNYGFFLENSVRNHVCFEDPIGE